MEERTKDMYDREQAAAYLGVTPHTLDYYTSKLPRDRRLYADFKVKAGLTYKHLYTKETLDKFKASLPRRGRPRKVQE